MRIGLTVSTLIIVAFLLLLTVTGKAQRIANEKVTLGLKDESLETAIKKIEQQSHFTFYYRQADICGLSHLNLTWGTRTIEQTLEALLQNTALSFRQMDDYILLEKKDPQTTGEITGRVINSLDNKPVANASVFLSNATIGGRTAADGTFTLNNIKPGKYVLVVSIVGFETYMKPVTANNTDKILPDIVITPKTIILSEINVRATNDPDRARNYEWFKNEFLGTSRLAADCKILNPEVLDLNYDRETGVLTASANDFLNIENRALGYNLKYLLTDFVKFTGEKHALKVQYSGSAFFQEIQGTPGQEKRWLKKRREVYEGSAMHFLRSALNNSFDEEGFRVLRIANTPNLERPNDSTITAKISFFEKLKRRNKNERDSLIYWRVKALLPKTFQTLEQTPLEQADMIKLTNQKGLYALLRNDGGLYITYNKKRNFKSDYKLDKLGGADDKQSTVLKFDIPYVLFDKNGGILNPDCVTFLGAWGKSRVADLLPVDYDPAETAKAFSGNISQNNDNRLHLSSSISLKAALLQLKSVSDSTSQTRSSEKPYLTFDKPYYTVGDTIWFKALLLKSTSLLASDKSAIVYIDIANDSDKMVKRYSIPVQNGLGQGNISLDEKEFSPGTYTIRAYTRWMRNFGDDYFFFKTFYITGADEKGWLISKQVSALKDTDNQPAANVKLQFSNFKGIPVADQSFRLQVFDGDKHLYKQILQTGQNGLMDFNLKFPEKASNLIIEAESTADGKKAIIPILLNCAENTDVQFLPEGGNLVAGLTAHIGFKAIGGDGRGAIISGVIVSNEQKQVAKFKAQHNGMGSFDLPVKEGETYTAKVTLLDGSVKAYPLPAVKSTGTVLQVSNPFENDSLEVTVQASGDLKQQGDSYFLIGKARGVVCYAAVLNFRDDNFIKRKIAKSLFPTGITRFTLMTVKGQPLNERLVFIEQDDLNIKLMPNKHIYAERDSASIKIQVTDNSGEPIEGNFSAAVTDDAAVKTDTQNDENILSRLLLTSDLKGYVEQPGYYLLSKTAEAWQALDNLLLTQGWVGYDWGKVFDPPQLTYQPEHEFTVKGRVTNVFNKPVKGTDVLLFSKSPSILMDTATDKDGRFVFDRFPRVDTPIFVIKAVNKRGGSFNVGITVDEANPPVFTKPFAPIITPWYVNSDPALISYTKRNAQLQQQEYYKATGHLLKEVKITAKKIIKDSQNLNGPGNADIVLDEKDMEAAGKKNWLQLFQDNIKGFGEGAVTSFIHTDVSAGGGMLADAVTASTDYWYRVKYKRVVIIIDGILLDSTFSVAPTFGDEQRYLESHNADDIKGIEVNFSDKYSDRYELRFGGLNEVFIEITTRSGSGPFMHNTPGMYLYKALALGRPKEFYKPKYTVRDTANWIPDFRSTIDWEPNINTDDNGEAKFSFFTADKPATYTVIIEGSDMNGNLGFKTGKITVDANTSTESMPAINGK